MASFEDFGQYYASEEMQKDFLIISMSSRLIYDIEDITDVKLIKKITNVSYDIAMANIKSDERCFYGEAAVYTNYEGKLVWEL